MQDTAKIFPFGQPVGYRSTDPVPPSLGDPKNLLTRRHTVAEVRKYSGEPTPITGFGGMDDKPSLSKLMARQLEDVHPIGYECARVERDSDTGPADRSLRPLFVEEATSRVLADVEEISNWLAGACVDMTRVSSDWEARTPDRLRAAQVPVVLNAALVAADRGDADGCLAAMGLLVRGYLVENDKRVIEIASELQSDSEYRA